MLLLTILFIIHFSSIGDSDPLVSLPQKKYNNPNHIGCLTCSQENLLSSSFDTHIRLSDENFSTFLNQGIHPQDSCHGMIESAEIFELSSIQRYLHGDGSHRKLITKLIFFHHTKFIHFIKKHFCEVIFIEYLLAGVFSDPFELQHLVRREVFRSAFVFGDTNLELPAAHSNRTVVEVHMEVESDAREIVLGLPLHSRYPPLDSNGYTNITIGKPDLFLRCRPRKAHHEDSSWALIDLGCLYSINVTWTVPCGKEAHTNFVSAATFLSALICSVLLVLSTIFLSKKNKLKLE